MQYALRSAVSPQRSQSSRSLPFLRNPPHSLHMSHVREGLAAVQARTPCMCHQFLPSLSCTARTRCGRHWATLPHHTVCTNRRDQRGHPGTARRHFDPHWIASQRCMECTSRHRCCRNLLNTAHSRWLRHSAVVRADTRSTTACLVPHLSLHCADASHSHMQCSGSLRYRMRSCLVPPQLDSTDSQRR